MLLLLKHLIKYVLNYLSIETTISRLFPRWNESNPFRRDGVFYVKHFLVWSKNSRRQLFGMIRAGLPPTIEFGGIFDTTTELAPITEFSPIVIGPTMNAPG